MTVYVDDARNPYGSMKMSHMIADSQDELHQMADRLGLRRQWFQDKNIPHYDVSQSKKKLAIELGAIEVSSRILIKIVRTADWAKTADRPLGCYECPMSTVGNGYASTSYPVCHHPGTPYAPWNISTPFGYAPLGCPIRKAEA